MSATDQIELAHQTQGAISATVHALFAQMLVDWPVTVGAVRQTHDLLNDRFDQLVLLTPGRVLRLGPTIISAARDAECFAHLGQIIFGLLSLHELEAAHSSLAK